MDIKTDSGRASKAAKTAAATSVHSHTSMLCNMLHLEMAMQRVLLALPLPELAHFLSACGHAQDLQWILQDAQLWSELLQQHFGGRRHVMEPTEEEDAAGEQDDEDDDEDEDEDDEDDNDDEEEEEEAGGDAQSDAGQTNGQAPAQVNDEASGTTATTDGQAAETSAPAATIDVANVSFPKWFNVNDACEEAREFVVSMHEWVLFRDRVVVLRGDIGVIDNINGVAVDGIAFPGNSVLSNPHNGASSVVFRRAGRQLEEHTRSLGVVLQPGQSHTTPAFNAGVRVLIHCHGPYIGYRNTFSVLAKTYRNVLRSAVRENVTCLALASISTGNHGLPIPQASQSGMRAIQKFLRAHHEWQGRIGIVCYDGDVLAGFNTQRDRVLAAFNVEE